MRNKTADWRVEQRGVANRRPAPKVEEAEPDTTTLIGMLMDNKKSIENLKIIKYNSYSKVPLEKVLNKKLFTCVSVVC